MVALKSPTKRFKLFSRKSKKDVVAVKEDDAATDGTPEPVIAEEEPPVEEVPQPVEEPVAPEEEAPKVDEDVVESSNDCFAPCSIM
jgi:hypothetical protein